MKKGIIYTLFAIFIFSSCGTTKIEKSLDHIQLGMTKREVISILGNNYTIGGAAATRDGNIETLQYNSENIMQGTSTRINFNFLEGKLVEWFREKPRSLSKGEHEQHPRRD